MKDPAHVDETQRERNRTLARKLVLVILALIAFSVAYIFVYAKFFKEGPPA